MEIRRIEAKLGMNVNEKKEWEGGEGINYCVRTSRKTQTKRDEKGKEKRGKGRKQKDKLHSSILLSIHNATVTCSTRSQNLDQD